MSYSTEFIKDKIYTHANWQDFAPNAIAVICGRWKITNDEYPNGFAYHYFEKEVDCSLITPSNFVAIADFTNDMLEACCTAGDTPNTLLEIQVDGLNEIRRSHWMATLDLHYENTD
jgi:hypothetical protein